MTQDELKTLVGHAALQYVLPGEIVGVGTGSTVNKFIEALATIKDQIRGAVSSSVASTDKLLALGITVFDTNEVDELAVYIDGADEIDAKGYMVKGGGAALTREKIVAAMSKSFVCIADESKLVDVLGTFPLPVEVIPMAAKRISAQFAAIGGTATVRMKGGQPLVTDNGQRQPDFLLGDVLGVSLENADWTDREHYLAPTEVGRPDFPGWEVKYPAFVRGPTMDVRSRPGAMVLATRTLPWSAPDPRGFSSIHSNPPWQATGQPEIVYHRVGQGAAVYSASLIEEVETLQESFVRLLRRLCVRPSFEVTAHPAVEVTLFHQPERRRYLLSLVNFQHSLPNLPVDGIEVRLRLPHRLRQIRVLPSGDSLRFHSSADVVAFNTPRLQTLLMLALTHA